MVEVEGRSWLPGEEVSYRRSQAPAMCAWLFSVPTCKARVFTLMSREGGAQPVGEGIVMELDPNCHPQLPGQK